MAAVEGTRQMAEATARALVDANLYMVRGTTDRDGTPWVSPVYYAHQGYREFFWVSRPEAGHSRNLEARREASVVIFHSTVPIGTARGVYMSAVAERVDGDERA